MISTTMRLFLRLLGFTSILLSANAQAVALENTHHDSTLFQSSEQPTLESEILVQLADPKKVAIDAQAAVLVPVWVVVKEGQTLWRIAVNNTPKGLSPWQTLISLYRENQAGFRNSDIRQVLANSKLRVPTLGELTSLTAEQAKEAYDVLVPAPVYVQHMQVLDQQLEAKQTDLDQAKQDLVQAKLVSVTTEENITLAAPANVINNKDEQITQWLSVVKMSTFWWVPIILVAGLIWWVIGRGRRVLPEHKTPPEIPKDESITLDTLDTLDTLTPLVDYDTKRSAKTRLSVDVEAMLTGKRVMYNQADEPVEYLSHDENMNTKLDLALSYRDMGEVPKAQSILREVLQLGDAEQQAQASAILSSINRA